MMPPAAPHRGLAPTALVLVVLAVLVAAAGCPPSGECQVDADCSGGTVCSGGSCVQCNTNDQCGADSFCCLGVCHGAADVESHCGCSPALRGSAGQDCGGVEPAGLCLVADSTASVATVAEGTCGCGCTPAQGGPICAAPATAGDAAVCSCNENADCKKASEDAAGHPHRAADTCTPQATCVCFSAAAANAQLCAPDGAAPDCTLGGCVSLVDDANNCGVPGKVCTDEATGIADTGTCIGGGCSCNAAGDCAGGGNVDTCVFPAQGDPSCVCGAYRRAGQQVACPMALDCTTSGCILDGTAFQDEETLLSALGLPPAP